MKQAAFFIFTSLFFFCINLKAQEPLTYSPIVSIERKVEEAGSGASGFVKRTIELQKSSLKYDNYVCPPARIIFTAKISDELSSDEKSKIKFKWTVSGGSIREGQDTAAVKVVNIESSKKIDVTVELNNLPKKFSNRKNQASSSVHIAGVCDVSTCTSINIISPEIIFDTDKTFTARARLGNPEMEEPDIYEWEITNGYIIEGQGTKEIKVVFQGSKDGDKCIVSLKIKDDDLPPECPFTATSIVTLWKKN